LRTPVGSPFGLIFVFADVGFSVITVIPRRGSVSEIEKNFDPHDENGYAEGDESSKWMDEQEDDDEG